MNQNSVGNQVARAAIDGLIKAFGAETFFHETMVAVDFIQKQKPGLTQTEKKALIWQFIKTENKIFFEDVVIKVAEDIIDILIPIAIFYLNAYNPLAGAAAAAILPPTQEAIKTKINADVEQRHLSTDEQLIMKKALAASSELVAKGHLEDGQLDLQTK